MRRTLGLALIGVLSLAGSARAGSQDAPPSPPPQQGAPPMEQRATQPTARPLFSIFGLPVQLNAPVAAPYCNCPFQNFGGQPERSRDAVARQATKLGE